MISETGRKLRECGDLKSKLKHSKYLKKGSMLTCHGNIKYNEWVLATGSLGLATCRHPKY